MKSDTRRLFTQWYTVFGLMLVYIFALIDRQIISLLIGDIKRDLSLDDFQAGLLMGPAFGVFYIIGGPLFGFLVDRISRKKVLAIGLSVWSVATMACGMTSSYFQLIIARMFVGAGEASVAPSSYSLISDIFPRERIASALSIFAIGGTVGGGGALLIGGALLGAIGNDGISLPIIGHVAAWQAVFLAIGAPGILLLFVVASLEEPRNALKKSTGKTDDTQNIESIFTVLKNRKKFFICHFLAFCTAGIVAYSIAGWSPEFMIRTYGWEKSQVGLALGAITVVTSILSHVVTGLLIDYCFSKGMKDAHFRIFLYMLIIAFPAMMFSYSLASANAFLVGYFILLTLVVPFTAFASSSLQIATPSRHRGKMSGIFLALLGLVGLSIGPSLVGFFSRYVLNDESQLGLSITVVGSCGMALMLIFLSMGLKSLREVVTDQEQQ